MIQNLGGELLLHNQVTFEILALQKQAIVEIYIFHSNSEANIEISTTALPVGSKTEKVK
jgi:hypothetical protein